MRLFTKEEFKKIKIGQLIYSDLHNCFLVVECISFIEFGIVWLIYKGKRITFPHIIDNIRYVTNIQKQE